MLGLQAPEVGLQLGVYFGMIQNDFGPPVAVTKETCEGRRREWRWQSGKDKGAFLSLVAITPVIAISLMIAVSNCYH